jgi:hypothetical protein
MFASLRTTSGSHKRFDLHERESRSGLGKSSCRHFVYARVFLGSVDAVVVPRIRKAITKQVIVLLIVNAIIMIDVISMSGQSLGSEIVSPELDCTRLRPDGTGSYRYLCCALSRAMRTTDGKDLMSPELPRGALFYNVGSRCYISQP